MYYAYVLKSEKDTIITQIIVFVVFPYVFLTS